LRNGHNNLWHVEKRLPHETLYRIPHDSWIRIRWVYECNPDTRYLVLTREDADVGANTKLGADPITNAQCGMQPLKGLP